MEYFSIEIWGTFRLKKTRSTQKNGKVRVWSLATTKNYRDPAKAVLDYRLRWQIEERYKQIKAGWFEKGFNSTSFILAGPKISFILDIEPILPGEGEISSAYRLMERVCKNYPKAFSVVIGDGLYLKETVFNLLERHHKHAVAVLKEERRQLFEEANRLSLLSEPEVYRRKKHITESGAI